MTTLTDRLFALGACAIFILILAVFVLCAITTARSTTLTHHPMKQPMKHHQR